MLRDAGDAVAEVAFVPAAVAVPRECSDRG